MFLHISSACRTSLLRTAKTRGLSQLTQGMRIAKFLLLILPAIRILKHIIEENFNQSSRRATCIPRWNLKHTSTDGRFKSSLAVEHVLLGHLQSMNKLNSGVRQ